MTWLVVFCFLLFAHTAHAQLIFGGGSGSSIANSATLTFACDAGLDSNRGLYVLVGQRGMAISSVTFDTTQTFSLVDQDTGIGSLTFHLYRLLNPNSGAHNVVVTLGSSSTQLAAICIPVANLDQADPDDPVAKSSGTGSTPSISVTSGLDDDVIGAFWSERSTSGTITPDASDNQIFELESILSNARAMAAAYTAGTGGTVTVSWTTTGITGSENWRSMGLNLNPSGAAPSGRRRRLMYFQ